MEEFLEKVSVEKPRRPDRWQAVDVSEKPRWGQERNGQQKTSPAVLAKQRVTKEESEALTARLEIMRRMGLCRERKCGRGDFEKCKDPHGCGITRS